MALLFIVHANGALLAGAAPANLEIKRELKETSSRVYWAYRRALVVAPSFYGEKTDLNHGEILVTHYLIHTRRVTESRLTTIFAVGSHIRRQEKA